MDISAVLLRINRFVLNPFIYLLFLIATVTFVWGLIVFISNADSDEARSVGKKHMVWGIVGMVIMMSAYAILAIVTGAFGVSMPF